MTLAVYPWASAETGTWGITIEYTVYDVDDHHEETETLHGKAAETFAKACGDALDEARRQHES